MEKESNIYLAGLLFYSLFLRKITSLGNDTMSSAESFNAAYTLHCMKMNKNESGKCKWRLLLLYDHKVFCTK